MRTLVKNIKSLVQVEESARKAVCGADMSEVKCIDNAYLIVEDDKIADFGKMEDLKETNADKIVDANNRFVLPSFCDSHTHLVYAGSREIEYIDKIRGLSYEGDLLLSNAFSPIDNIPSGRFTLRMRSLRSNE